MNTGSEIVVHVYHNFVMYLFYEKIVLAKLSGFGTPSVLLTQLIVE